MKTNKYTIKDENYFTALKCLSEELKQNKISYAIVGAAGVQARIANILTEGGKTSLSKIPGLEYLIRGTGDIDIATNASHTQMVNMFNTIAISYPDLNVQSTATKSPIILGININYETSPSDFKEPFKDFYYDIIKTAEALNLKIVKEYIDYATYAKFRDLLYWE